MITETINSLIYDKWFPSEIFDRISFKKPASFMGEDMPGFATDIYLDKKKVGYYLDSGNGGESQITFDSNAAEITVKDIFERNSVKNLMYTKLGWDFYDTIEEIDFESCFDVFTEQWERKQIIKKSESKTIHIISGKRDSIAATVKLPKQWGVASEMQKKGWVKKFIDDLKTDDEQYQIASENILQYI